MDFSHNDIEYLMTLLEEHGADKVHAFITEADERIKAREEAKRKEQEALEAKKAKGEQLAHLANRALEGTTTAEDVSTIVSIYLNSKDIKINAEEIAGAIEAIINLAHVVQDFDLYDVDDFAAVVRDFLQ